jgi:hypothetical protein
VIAQRLIRGRDKISCDFATCSPPSRLAPLQHEEAEIGTLGLIMEEKDMSTIGTLAWQKFGNSTCYTRGALDRRLGSESRIQYSMGSRDTSGWRTIANYRLSRFFRHNLAKAEAGLGIARQRWHLTSLQSAIACTPPPWQAWGGLGYNANGLDVKV